MFGLELKKSLNNIRIPIVIIIILLISYCISLPIHFEYYGSRGPINMPTYMLLIINGLNSMNSLFRTFIIICIPLLVIYAYCANIYKEVKNNYVNYIYTRYSKNKYILIKCSIGFIVGFLVIFIPLVVNFGITFVSVPMTLEGFQPWIYDIKNNSKMFAYAFALNNPIIAHAIVVVFISFVFGVIAMTSAFISFQGFKIQEIMVLTYLPIISCSLMEMVPSIGRFNIFRYFKGGDHSTFDIKITSVLASILIFLILELIVCLISFKIAKNLVITKKPIKQIKKIS